MNTHDSGPPARGGRHFTSTLTLLFLIVLAFGLAMGTAQGPAQDGEKDGGEPKEREIEIRMGAHLPFKVTLKNLEKMKDLKNEDWLRCRTRAGGGPTIAVRTAKGTWPA